MVLNLKLNLKIEKYLPFIFFVAAAIGVVLAAFFKVFFIFSSLAFFTLVLAVVFLKSTKIVLSDICLFLAVVFSFAALSSCAYLKNIADFAGREEAFTLTVISLPRETPRYNLIQGDIKNISGIPVSCQAVLIDYTKSLEYLKRYKVAAKAGVIERNGRSRAYLWVTKNSKIVLMPQGVILPLSRAFNAYVLQKFKDNFHDGEARFLSSLFLGRYELLKKERQFFVDAGVSHVVLGQERQLSPFAF